MIQARLQISGQINGREKLSGGLNTSIKEIKPELENIKIIPKTEQQEFKSEKYGYDKIIVEPVTSSIDEDIKPENIKKGTNILGVEGGYEGVDTSDGNIVSQDLNVGKVAYSQGKRIEGTYDTSKNVGVTPYKNLKIMSDQTSLANYYIKKFKDGTIKNANTYVLKTKSKNKDNSGKLDVAEFMFCSNTPALIFAQSIGDYKSNYFFHKEFTENFIQFDNQLGAGLTASFINQKGITQAELLELEGWYDENLNLIVGDIECGTCIVQYIAKINIFDYFSNKVTPQNLIPCSNLDELNINISYDEYSTFNEKFIDIDFFLNSKWLSLENQAAPSDISEGKTAYNGYGKITGTGKMLTITEDATATASDILVGKTAYVNNEKIEGAIETYDESYSGNVAPKLKITSGLYLFQNGARTDYINEILDLCENITSAQGMFSGCSNLDTLNLSNLDTSNVTKMNEMFVKCSKLLSLDCSNFDTSKVDDMMSMFHSCYKMTNLDCSSFDTNNVTNMSYMFYCCYDISDLDLSNFDMSKVYNISTMFSSCSNLTNLKSFKNLGKGYKKSSGYNVSSYKLNLTSSTNLTYKSLIDILTNGLYDLNLTYNVANGGILYTQGLVLGSTNLAKLTAEEIAIATNKGWTVS